MYIHIYIYIYIYMCVCVCFLKVSTLIYWTQFGEIICTC